MTEGACGGTGAVLDTDDGPPRIEHGRGRAEDLDLLNSIADNIQGRTICALGDAAAMPVRAMLKHFKHEFVAMIEQAQKNAPATSAALPAKTPVAA